MKKKNETRTKSYLSPLKNITGAYHPHKHANWNTVDREGLELLYFSCISVSFSVEKHVSPVSLFLFLLRNMFLSEADTDRDTVSAIQHEQYPLSYG